MADPNPPPTSPYAAAAASPRASPHTRTTSLPVPPGGPPPATSLRRLSTRVSATLRRVSAAGAVTPETTLTPGARRLLSVRASEWARDEALRQRAEHGKVRVVGRAVGLFVGRRA